MNAHINGRNVVVTVTGEPDDELTRAAARKVACQEAHTALIGKLLSVKETRDGHAYTWGPVTARKTGAARKAAPVKATHAPDSPAADVLAMLGTLGLAPDVLATIAGMLPAAPVKAAPKREFAPVKAARERAEAAACKTCRDFGVVRIAPRDNGDVHFRTPNGATGATAIGRSKPCEARGCKAGKAARKARKAA